MRKKTTVDPIFAKIREYQRKEKAFIAAIDALTKAENSGNRRRVLAAERVEDAKSDASIRALARVCRTHPKTTAGLIAKFEALKQEMNEAIDGVYRCRATDGLWQHLQKSVERLAKAGQL